MTACCPEFKTAGFTTRLKKGHVVHTCYACKRDVTREVLDLFFADPFKTVSLKRKGGSKQNAMTEMMED